MSNVLIDLEKIEASTFENKLSYASYLIINLYRKKIPFSLRYKKFSTPFSCELENRNNALIYLSNVKINFYNYNTYAFTLLGLSILSIIFEVSCK